MSLRIFLIIMLWFMPISVAQADAGSDIPLARLARQADMIVEGSVEGLRPDADHNIPGYIGESKNTVSLTVGARAVVSFQPEKIYKGRLPDGAVLKIISTPASAEAFAEIADHNRYILFLKKARGRDGYIILENGKGQFRIFDYNGVERIKTWFQLPHYRKPESYLTYQEFRQSLEELVAKHPGPSPSP